MGVPRLVLIVPTEELPKVYTTHVPQLDPGSCTAPSVTNSVGGAVVEELGGEKQDQTQAVVCVNSKHLMGAYY